jgi:predicted MFS family arabinose efflux permease
VGSGARSITNCPAPRSLRGPSLMPRNLSERSLLLLIGAVQFVNVLDFMMVMPLGPDFAADFGVPNARLGFVGASYTLAAALSGIVGSTFLDRFDRRKALAVALVGLVLSTAAGGLVSSFEMMLATRCLAGAFGGPASALALAIVSDVIPPARRGRAMAAVLGAFAISSVLGVPVGLELAHLGGWRLPFFAVALFGTMVAALAIFLLPPLVGHLFGGAGKRQTKLRTLLKRPEVVLALAANALVMLGHFAIVPNLAAYVQFNFGYPREDMGLLYFVGGLISLGTMRVAGWLADRVGPPRVAAGATLAYVTVLFFSFVVPLYSLPVHLLFAGFMVTSSFRAVPMRALSSRVPNADERARYMSSQSALDHIAAAGGALLGSQLLRELPGGRLDGMAALGWVTITLSSLVPLLLFLVDRRVRQREQDVTAAVPTSAAAPSGPGG